MQNYIGKLVSIVALSTLTVSAAMAAGHVVKITMDCPDIGTKGSEIVTNYGSYLAGPGVERVNSDTPTAPLFQGPVVPGANIPVDLVSSGYFQSGTNYNPTNGAVTCYYQSSMGFDPFSLSYVMVNAINGTTTSAGVDKIHIKLPVGLK